MSGVLGQNRREISMPMLYDRSDTSNVNRSLKTWSVEGDESVSESKHENESFSVIL